MCLYCAADNEWRIMEQWWNDTDRGKLEYWEKTLYSVGCRWMNEYGALVEWYWQEKLKYWEKNIIQRRWKMNEWVWGIGGMILTGETEVLGEKTLYSVGGRWMNEYGALMEWYWQGKTEVLGEKNYTASGVDEWIIMEHWWNDTDRGKLKYWEQKSCLL